MRKDNKGSHERPWSEISMRWGFRKGMSALGMDTWAGTKFSRGVTVPNSVIPSKRNENPELKKEADNVYLSALCLI